MAEYLGFEPIKSGERYYISYTEEDNKKVGSITSYLNMMGVPMWYDHGFSVDYEREAVISKNLVESLAVIIFVSKNAFSDADAYMWTEYIAARNEKKVRYVLWLDTVTVSDVDDELKTIYADILRLQEIKITSKLWKPEDIAWKMVRSFSLVWNDERLLECAFSLLKEKKYILAEQYCESVLDKNHRNGRAHLGRMMARLNVQSIEALAECHEPFDDIDDYNYALEYCDASLRLKLIRYDDIVKERIEENIKNKCYNDAVKKKNRASKGISLREQFEYYIEAGREFQKIILYKDASELAADCFAQAESLRKDIYYDDARLKMGSGSIEGYEKALESLGNIHGYKDADKLIDECQMKIEEIKERRKSVHLESKDDVPEEVVANNGNNVWIPILIIGIILFCLIFAIVLQSVIIPRLKYNKAVKHIDEGNYDAAKTLLSEVDQKEKRLKYDIENYMISNAEVGGSLIFGSYEQDNDLSNGKENIEWLVLDEEDGFVLVISKLALDCQQYNNTMNDVVWDTCALRKWLNGTFIKEAFNKNERTIVQKVIIDSDDDIKYATTETESKSDGVFLLGIPEINRYLSSDDSRKCELTTYATAQGAWSDNSNGECWWWLRSTGYDKKYAMSIRSDGSINGYGNRVDNDSVAIRPALWIKRTAESE